MKTFIVSILILELLLAYFIFAPTCILRREYQDAFSAYIHNPTPETRAEMNRQGRISGLFGLGFVAVIFCLMAAPTLATAWVWRRRHPVKPEPKITEEEATNDCDY